MPRSSAKTKQRIVDAAYGLFWRRGFLRVSMDQVAARAEITKRTLYQHYRSKDDLIAATLANSSTLALARLQRIGDRLPRRGSAAIDSLFDELGAWAAKPGWSGAGFTRVVVELADLPGHPARKIARTHKAAVETWLANLLAKAKIPLARQRAREVALLLEGAMMQMLIYGDRSYARAAANAAKTLIRKR